jgi:hypothetical protein
LAPSTSALKDKDILCLGHLRRVFPLLDQLNDVVGRQRDKAGNRRLFFGDYCKLVLLYIWNPLIDSMRQLQRATELKTVAKALNVPRFSLGSFSEAPAVFEPQRLAPILAELAGQLPDGGSGGDTPLFHIDPRLTAELKQALTLVDGTVVAALARLARAAVGDAARYNVGRDGVPRYAWRLHAQLDLGTFSAHRLDRTGARNGGDQRENNVLRRNLEADRCYVADGGFADRTLFNDIVEHAGSYVIRLAENATYEVAEERPLSQEDLRAGVLRDVVLNRLGGGGNGGGDPAATTTTTTTATATATATEAMNHRVRLITVKVQPHPRRTRKARAGVLKGTRYSDQLLIATNLLELPAELVALVYRYRYTVELFFRVLKQLLGMRHLLSQRPNGIDIQVQCTLIVCLLLCLISGHRPDKTTRNMIGWYLAGLASEEELLAYLNRPDNTGVKQRAKDELWKKLGV